jgi:hypothetical protein
MHRRQGQSALAEVGQSRAHTIGSCSVKWIIPTVPSEEACSTCRHPRVVDMEEALIFCSHDLRQSDCRKDETMTDSPKRAATAVFALSVHYLVSICL